MFVLISLVVILIIFLNLWLKKKYSYWKDRNVHYSEPTLFFGCLTKFFFRQQTDGECYRDVYFQEKNHRYVGIYQMTNPALLLRDPDLIEKVMIKDFSYFVDRFEFVDNEFSEVDSSLFVLPGAKWRGVRLKTTPAFTTGKLKNMFPQFIDCSENFLQYINKLDDKDVNLAETCNGFSLDLVASTVFGMTISEDPNAEFRKMARIMFKQSFTQYMTVFIFTFYPKLANFFNLTFTPKVVGRYYAKIIKETFKYRKENNIHRNDFVQMLLNLKEQGSIQLSSRDKEDNYLYGDEMNAKSEDLNINLTDNILISQAFSFLMAGFDIIGTQTNFLLYLLTQKPECQVKLRNEINEVIEKHGKLSYEAVKDMKYMEQCIDEMFRLYPGVLFLFRLCTNNYTFDDGMAIEKGTMIIIPVYGLHRDEAYFENPDEFIPERFKEFPKKLYYLPFGQGPRICIGMRYALVALKMCAITVLKNFEVTLSEKTKLPIKLQINVLLSKPQTPLYFNLKPIKKIN